MGWAEDPKKGEYRSPIRLAFFMIPNGVNQDEWKPKAGMTTPYPRILMPLAPVMNEVMVINNLLHAKARANGDGAGDHARESSTFLTGTQCKKTSGADISTGISIDQKLAETLGVYTSLPSLELGMEGGGQAGNCDSGYSCAYSSNISWRTPTSPMAKETNPKAVFDRMFAARSAGQPKRGGPAVDTSKFASKGGDDGGAPSLEQSVLDEVLSDAKSLKGSVGSNDQRKLDEFLDSVRALEKRIEHAELAAQEAAKQASEKKPGTYSAPITVTPPASPPTVYGERAKLMMDLITLAFQSDTTRIVSFSFGNGGSDHSYPELGVMGGHHEISHHGKDPVKLRGHRQDQCPPRRALRLSAEEHEVAQRRQGHPARPQHDGLRLGDRGRRPPQPRRPAHPARRHRRWDVQERAHPQCQGQHVRPVPGHGRPRRLSAAQLR